MEFVSYKKHKKQDFPKQEVLFFISFVKANKQSHTLRGRHAIDDDGSGDGEDLGTYSKDKTLCLFHHRTY